MCKSLAEGCPLLVGQAREAPAQTDSVHLERGEQSALAREQVGGQMSEGGLSLQLL